MSSKVYFTNSITTKGINKLLDQLGIEKIVKPGDRCAVKIHFGEKGNKGYIKPQFVKPVIDRLKKLKSEPFLTDTCTVYIGSRSDAVSHILTAAEHGFTLENCGCPVIISGGLRGNDGVEVEINKSNLKKIFVANEIYQSDSIVFLNHFKGHMFAGFGAAIKNMSMGCATRAGKYAMHNTVKPNINIKSCKGCGECIKWCSSNALSLVNGKINMDEKKCIGCGECISSCPNKVFSIPWNESVEIFQKKMAEYCSGIVKNKRFTCINFLNHVTKNCDCSSTPETPLIDNIGIVAGDDPVAVDQASVDIVSKKFGSDFCRHIFPGIDYTIQFSHGEKIGLGTRKYDIVNVD